MLLLTNFGERERLTVDGRPGRPAAARRRPTAPQRPAGSCIGIVVTDAPVDGADCARLARRIGLGLARTGSTAHHGSGEIFLGVSATGLRLDRDGTPGRHARVAGRGPRRPVRGRGRGGRGGGARTRCSPRRPTVGRDGNTSERPRPRRGRCALLRGARPCRALSARSGSRWPTASSWPRRSTSPTTPRGPQPCLLEALPYRKDDLTSSYAAGYRPLRDEFGYAVCRLDLRGTGSSAGDATDEYPAAEQRDLVEVIAWLAEQDVVRRQRRHVRARRTPASTPCRSPASGRRR